MGMRWFLAAALLLLGGAAVAQAPQQAPRAASAPTELKPASAIDADAALAGVVEAKARAYRDTLARYASAQQASPRDAAVAVAKCRFIHSFTDDEAGEWVGSGADDFEACLAQLRADWSAYPEAQLYLFLQNWDEGALAEGEALLEAAERWPKPLRGPFYAAMAYEYNEDERSTEAQRMSLRAARLGMNSSVPSAVRELVAQGKQPEATRMLADSRIGQTQWQADRRIEAAMLLDDAEVARREIARHVAADVQPDPVLAGRAHLRARDLVSAKSAVEAEDADEEATRQIRFDIALAGGDIAAAAAQVDVTDIENIGLNLQRFAVLATQAPGSMSNAPMLLMLLGFAGFVMLLALAPVALLLPVHYRGLQRRIAGRATVAPFARIGLRHTWWAMAVVSCVSVIALALVEPASLASAFEGELPGAEATFRIMLWTTLGCLLLLLPMVYRMGRVPMVGNLAMLRQWAWVLGSLAIVWAVGLLLGVWHQWRGQETSTDQTRMVDMLVNGRTSGVGLAASFLVIVVLVPILEELVYRGLVLGGLARHISFGWANLIQATIFAAMHDDPPRFVFYLTMGLLAGLLVRRSRSLAPAIVLHMLNNGLAFWLKHQ